MAESVGFEPTWLAPNGFQDRLVMTASITLPVLYSLIYKRVKKEVGIDLSSRAVASQVFSAHTSLTTVFGMGTGGSSQLWTPTILFSLKIFVSSKLNNTQSNSDAQKTLPSSLSSAIFLNLLFDQALDLLVSVN